MNFPEALKIFLEHNPNRSSHEIILTWLNALFAIRDNLKLDEWKSLLRFYIQRPNFNLTNIDDMYNTYGKHPVVKDIWFAKQDVLAFKRFAEKNETRDREDVFHMGL